MSNEISRVGALAIVVLNLDTDDPKAEQIRREVAKAHSVADLPEWIRKAGTKEQQ